MGKRVIHYRVVDHCEDSYYALETAWDLGEEPGYVAEEAAKNYFEEHDGWEASWPLTISLHIEEGGPEVARFVVELEAEPVFTASQA